MKDRPKLPLTAKQLDALGARWDHDRRAWYIGTARVDGLPPPEDTLTEVSPEKPSKAPRNASAKTKQPNRRFPRRCHPLAALIIVILRLMGFNL